MNQASINHYEQDRRHHGCGRIAARVFAAPALMLCIAAASHAEPAPTLPDLRPVQRIAMTLPDGDPADVYLPRSAPAVRERFVDALPAVALLQGALVDKGQYSHIARLIAQQGFVVVVANHAREVPSFPQPVLFAEVDTVNVVYDAMAAADADPSSPFYRIIDTEHMGLVGHSLGGAVGLYAIAGVCLPGICSTDPATYAPPSALKAAVMVGANLFDRRTGELTDLDTSAAAVALLQGSLDGIADAQKARASYEALEPPRTLVAVEGMNHYGICNRNNPPGAEQDPVDPTLAQTAANRAIARWTGLWLRAHLLDDAAAKAQLDTVSGDAKGVIRLIAAEP
jgi:dienelactone hydrolase